MKVTATCLRCSAVLEANSTKIKSVMRQHVRVVHPVYWEKFELLERSREDLERQGAELQAEIFERKFPRIFPKLP
jgi:hypothetical protein